MKPFISDNTKAKIQQHLSEAASLLRKQCHAYDWAGDIEATAHAIENDFNEQKEWDKTHGKKILIIRKELQSLASEHNIELKSHEIDWIVENVIENHEDENDESFELSDELKKEILSTMIRELRSSSESVFS
jgi:predicted secreted Zn-dependent protease